MRRQLSFNKKKHFPSIYFQIPFSFIVFTSPTPRNTHLFTGTEKFLAIPFRFQVKLLKKKNQTNPINVKIESSLLLRHSNQLSKSLKLQPTTTKKTKEKKKKIFFLRKRNYPKIANDLSITDTQQKSFFLHFLF